MLIERLYRWIEDGVASAVRRGLERGVTDAEGLPPRLASALTPALPAPAESLPGATDAARGPARGRKGGAS